MSSYDTLKGLWDRYIGSIAVQLDKNREFQRSNLTRISEASRLMMSGTEEQHRALEKCSEAGDGYHSLIDVLVRGRGVFPSCPFEKMFKTTVLAEHYWAERFATGRETDINGRVFSIMAEAARDIDDEVICTADEKDVFRVAYRPCAEVEEDEGGEILVLVHGRFRGHERIRPILFQGKRTNKGGAHSVNISRDSGGEQQLSKMIRNQHSAYLFYNQSSRSFASKDGDRTLIYPPSVLTAHHAWALASKDGKGSLPETWNFLINPVGENCLTLSTFLTFYMFWEPFRWPDFATPEKALSAVVNKDFQGPIVYAAAGRDLHVRELLLDLENRRGISFKGALGNLTATDVGTIPEFGIQDGPQIDTGAKQSGDDGTELDDDGGEHEAPGMN